MKSTKEHKDYKTGFDIGVKLAAWDNDNGHFPQEVSNMTNIMGKAQYHIGLLDGMKSYKNS